MARTERRRGRRPSRPTDKPARGFGCAPANATVGEVLDLAEIDTSGRTIMLDGANTSTDQVPRNGATITVTQKIKGN